MYENHKQAPIKRSRFFLRVLIQFSVIIVVMVLSVVSGAHTWPYAMNFV